jgi:CheY-like chemotaxis protein
MILFIDDELDFVESYREGLSDAGYEVQLMSDLDEAYTFLRQRYDRVQLVIFDVMIEGDFEVLSNVDTNGGKRAGEKLLLEVLGWENENKKCPTVPKIIFTNVKEPAFLDRWRRDADVVAACLRKPYTTVAELVRVVRANIGGVGAHV